MRSFLQKKAGATYFSDSNVTVSVRKHNFEIIFALNGGWHAVISFTSTPDGVIMLAGLGSMSDELDKILPSLRLKPGEHSKFIEMLEGKSEYHMLCVDFDGKGHQSGIGKRIDSGKKPHLQILGDPSIHLEAEKLFRHTLDIYSDLQKSPYPSLKSLTSHFID